MQNENKKGEECRRGKVNKGRPILELQKRNSKKIEHAEQLTFIQAQFEDLLYTFKTIGLTLETTVIDKHVLKAKYLPLR